MTSNDDQRAAAVEWAMKLQAGTVLAREVDRLCAELEGVRAEWAETRSADVDVIVGLRAELAETRAAGDALAEVLGRMKPDRGQATADAMDALDGWRSVRGDAPTESVSWNDLDRATATIRRVMPSDATTVICGVDVEEVAREKLPDGAFRVTTRRRGDAPAPAEPPAAPEPTRWSTLDDAMRVAHERPLISACTWHSRSECVCPVHDVVRRLSDAGMLRDAAPAATPEPPAVELPMPHDTEQDAIRVLDGPVVGYVLGRREPQGTWTLWDDDVRESLREIQIAHAEHIDEVGTPSWRCYELRDVCTDAGQPVRGSQAGSAS